MTSPSPPQEYRILALYRFVPLVTPANESNDTNNKYENDSSPETQWDSSALMAHPEQHPTLKRLRSELYETLRPWGAKGTLLIAPEGINGTICYPFPPPAGVRGGRDAVATAAASSGGTEDEGEGNFDPVSEYLKHHELFGGPELRTRTSVWNEDSESDDEVQVGNEHCTALKEMKHPRPAFQRLKIKIKAEIVTLGLGRPLEHRRQKLKLPTSEEDATVISDSKESIRQNMVEDANIDSTQPRGQILEQTSTLTDRHLQNQKANPLKTKGQYLTPSQWDEACRNPNVVVIDTRNTYEVEIGTFESALDPKTETFAEFPEYLETLANEYDWSLYGKRMDDDGKTLDNDNERTSTDDEEREEEDGDNRREKKKKAPPEAIAMFCTGGIRCEKATSFALQSKFFPEDLPIYHLEGGILAYLDHVAKRNEANVEAASQRESHGNHTAQQDESNASTNSTFKGECFVFDKRVALTEGLKPSKSYVSCYGCRGPMDRRLLLQDGEDDKIISNPATADNPSTKMYRGIPNLPPLRYDTQTKKYYLPGLTCPRCHSSTTRESLERFSQRANQMEICAREGKPHFRDGKNEEKKEI
mmetsp:Transcript_8041/g.16164  ORF Transcript_8041/g.16164 Transcript_8041/m.16164 type:complete len:588 (-) Transcript_8041:81-1844(-)